VHRGTHLVLRDSEGAQKVFWLGEGCKDLRMGRYPPIPLAAVLDAPYGATLRRDDGGDWVRQRPELAEPIADQAAVDCDDAGAEVYEHNAKLAQDNSAQALGPAEVRELKSRCAGEEVVRELASNSATFATKTKFAKEKYLKKKQQKHVQQVTLLRPSLMELCETYMKQSRNKVCGLRFDYLSSLLCQADVRTGGRYLAWDSACGLVVAAMAQQMAGCGQVFRMFRGGCPDKALSELDLGPRRAVVRPVPLEVLKSADPWSHEWLAVPAEPEGEAMAEEERSRLAVRRKRVLQRRADVENLQAGPVDGLIVVASDEEVELAAEAVEHGLTRLRPGGRFVMYGQYLQPLAARQGALRASGSFVDVRLHQLFTREYQVLPMRTHPIMTAEAMLCEGFVLSASKVIDDAANGAAERAAEAGAEAGGAPKRRRRS